MTLAADLTPEQHARRLAYYRQRYAAKRDEILAKRKAAFHADPDAHRAKNRHYYRDNREAILAQQKARREREDIRAARNDYFRRHRNLLVYGTETPTPGQRSLDGTKVYANFGGKFTCPPKPTKEPKAKPAAPTSGRSLPTKATLWSSRRTERRTRRSTQPSNASPATKSSPTPIDSPKPLWTPTPILGNEPRPFTPTKVTHLCSCGKAWPSKRLARKHKHVA